MKKIALTVLMASAFAAASPAFAQATGSVELTGTVTDRCTAVTPIDGSIQLGELSNADGTIDTAFSSAANGLTREFTIRCNGANPNVSVMAVPLVNAAAASPATGYTNTVHYTATVAAMGANGGTSEVADDSQAAGATTSRLGDRLAAEANNVKLTVSNGLTSNSTALLEAGAYQGRVDITVSPAA